VPLCVGRSAQLTARAPTPPAGGTDSDCRSRVLGHSSRCGVDAREACQACRRARKLESAWLL